MLGAFMPIILLVVIGIIAIVISYVISKQIKGNSRQSMFLKLGLYLLVLLIAMGLVLLVPIDQEVNDEEKIETENIPSLIDMAYNEELYDNINEFLVYQESFSYQDDKLNIRPIIPDDKWFTIYVLVEEKDEEDSTIEASLYQTPSIFDEVDITENIEPYQIRLNSDVLNITANEMSFSYAFFKSEFPFRQFTKDYQPMFNEDLHAGEQLIYLRVPKNMEIYVNDDEPISVHYIK